jgi:predicted transcriptional regulator
MTSLANRSNFFQTEQTNYTNQVVYDTLRLLAKNRHYCVATLAQLEERSGYSRSNVCRSLHNLVAQGVITKRQRHDKRGRPIANVYRLN